MNNDLVAVLLLVAALLFTALGASLYIYYGRLIMRSRVAGAPIPFMRMVRMTTSGVDAYTVVTEFIAARQAGLDLSLDDIEAQARTGADVRAVVKRLVEAKQSGANPSD